jgi:hypothetical protein
MDHYWYFPLLKGAVAHGLAIEKAVSEKLPAIKLTTAIGDASPIVLPVWTHKNRDTGVKENVWALKVRSQHKSLIFYGAIFALLIVLTVTSYSPGSKSVNGEKQTGLNLTPSLSVSSASSAATTINDDSRGEKKVATNACFERQSGANHVEINQTFVNQAPAATKQSTQASAAAAATVMPKAKAVSTQPSHRCDLSNDVDGLYGVRLN